MGLGNKIILNFNLFFNPKKTILVGVKVQFIWGSQSDKEYCIQTLKCDAEDSTYHSDFTQDLQGKYN